MLFTRVAPHTKSKGALDRRSTHLLLLLAHALPRIKSKGAPDRRSLIQQKLRLFTCVAPHTKSKGLPIDDHLLSKKYMLFTHVAPRIKSKGAPDRRSTHLLLLSARASPRIKSNGLHRYVLQIYYFINQVFKSFCSSVGIIIDSLALP
jgi:hypothetical protein